MNARLPDYREALDTALRGIEPLGTTEEIDLNDASGRVLSESIIADRDLPPFNRAQMDGYALRASEYSAGKSWPVAHVIAAGAPPTVRVPPGQCVAIATGAALPEDVDTVIQHELSDRADQRASGGPVRFAVDSIAAGNAVHHRGADAKKGQVLIPARTVMSAHHLGIAAAVGKTSIKVRTKVRAAILTSGDEVIDPRTMTTKLAPHQIRNSNDVMVFELVRRFGGDPVHNTHVRDERDPTIAAVRDALTSADLVITIGGVSAGDRDHFPTAFDACGVTRSLQGASIQPGRPVFVGRESKGTVVVGLPGNPVSVLACACLFVWPIVRVMSGLDSDLPWREVGLAEEVKPNPHRRAFRPAVVQDDGSVIVPSWAGSGDLAHTSSTHGLVELPVQTESVRAGSRLRFLPWP
jgi:molybdopterin molybdotransferase